ncbi:MAG TPA: sialate O-acetylesterase, partial [Armatimonadota bacterium]|nr:sialate O-acetylesterase [Armatimonadota bacterium]
MKSRLWPMLAMCGMLLLAFAQSALAANLTLPAIFCDNMVLQRGIKVPVWGTANPGDQVTVTFLKQHKSVKADAQGNWMVKLDKLKAGGPFEMTIASGTNTITYKNVLIGEVWVCSGQSNMEMVVRSSRNSADEIANSANQNIRLFTVRKKVSTAPLSTLDGQWTVCGPDTVGSFSAAGYFFGRELQKRLNVPVGLIHTSWGGTPAEAWTSHEFLLKDPDFQPILSRYKVPAG